MFINITNGSLDGMRIDAICYESHTFNFNFNFNFNFSTKRTDPQIALANLGGTVTHNIQKIKITKKYTKFTKDTSIITCTDCIPIFKTFQTLFPAASLIFTAVKVFIK